jgi:hypothetical protein
MIIIKTADEPAVVAELEKLLQNIDAEVHHSPDENLTVEEWLGVIALNVAKERQYLGRVVRNTEAISKDFRTLIERFEPVLSFFALELEDEDGSPITTRAAKAAERRRVALMKDTYLRKKQ